MSDYIKYSTIKSKLESHCISDELAKQIANDVVMDGITGDPFHIPNIYEICDKYPEIKQNYLDLYKKKLNEVPLPTKTRKNAKPPEPIDEDIKIAQGALFDGLVCCFRTKPKMKKELPDDADVQDKEGIAKTKKERNKESVLKKATREKGDHMKLATAVFDNKREDIKLSLIQGANKKGNLKAFELQPLYISGITETLVNFKDYEESVVFSSKITSMNQVTPVHFGVRGGEYILVPYKIIQKIMDAIEMFTNKGVMEITTQNYGHEKTRIVSTNTDIIKSTYLNVSETEADDSFEKLPLVETMYIPIVGVTSLSLARERVLLHQIQSLSAINKAKWLSHLPEVVSRDHRNIVNDIKDLEYESAIYALRTWSQKIYDDMSHDKNGEILAIFKELGVDATKIDHDYVKFINGAIAQIHGASTYAERKRILKSVRGLKKLVDLKKDLYDPEWVCDKELKAQEARNKGDQKAEGAIFDLRWDQSYEKLDAEQRFKFIYKKLKQGVCRLQYINNDLELMTIVATLNEDALRIAYGEQYEKLIASDFKKVKIAMQKVKQGMKFKDALQEAGIKKEIAEDKIESAENLIKNISNIDNDAVKQVYDALGFRTLQDRGAYDCSVKTLYAGIPGHVDSGASITIGLDKVIKVIVLKKFEN